MQEQMEFNDGNVSHALNRLKEFIFMLRVWDSKLDSVQVHFCKSIAVVAFKRMLMFLRNWTTQPKTGRLKPL